MVHQGGAWSAVQRQVGLLVLSYVYGVLHTTTWLTSQVLGLGDLRDMASHQTYVFWTTIRSREAVKILVI